jgi:hypothetical protein
MTEPSPDFEVQDDDQEPDEFADLDNFLDDDDEGDDDTAEEAVEPDADPAMENE